MLALGPVRKEGSQSAAWRAQSPRSNRERSEADGENGLRMPPGITVDHVRHSRPGHFEESAGICPFFESPKTRHKQCNDGEQLPEPEDCENVARVSKAHHHLNGIWPMRYVPLTAHRQFEH